MSDVFKDYKTAYNHAAKLATDTGLNMVIRKAREYGKDVFYINFKSNDGSDYLGETAMPNQPLMTEKESEK